MENTKKFSVMEFLQGLGRTFMLPVALLAFMGLLLGIGSAFTSPATIEVLPFLDNDILQAVFSFMSTIGGFAFSYLPVLFSMAIPLGMAKKHKGVAAFSGFVGYTVMHLAINFHLDIFDKLADADVMRQAGQGTVFGIQTLEMGVLGGIISGLIVLYLHNKYYDADLGDAFAFFSGTRFVPIITSLVMSVVGFLIPFIWPLFSKLIQAIGTLISKAGAFGPFLFGSGERLLLPFGLHHILVAMIRFTEAGGVAEVAGESVAGALNIFYAQMQAGEEISKSATAFLSQGKMPTFMFGLPAAALAMYHTAKPEKRSSIKGLLISGVIASAVTGITEPIEFLFLFNSPLLWVFHVIMTGAGFFVMSLLGVRIGNTDGGILDFLIFGVLQGSDTKWYLVLIVGIIWAVIYYVVFRYVILKYDLPTPGRGTDSDNVDSEVQIVKEETNRSGFDVEAILEALGGPSNIESLNSCVTRLRLVLSDGSIVQDDRLKELGALGVVHLDEKNVQVIIGTQVSSVHNELEELL